MALRKVKLKGNSVRSRQQWLQEGEKPSKFFCNLENKNFIEKTIKKVHLNDGSIVTDQKDILHHVRKFYANLFQSRDDRLMDFDFEKLGLKNNNKTTANEDLGKFLTVKELGFILKKMKHNKTPGIDGITAEFLKVFWGKLKFFIAN